MARPIRVEDEGAVYHVTARGNERRKVFRDDQDRQCFVDTLAECAERFGLVVHAYCLMPNHYHLIVETPRANLCAALGWLQTAYSIRFNRRHRRAGHLFQGRFKALVVEADAYACELVRYVHLNPVRPPNRKAPVPAERRKRLEQYPWSSHGAYAGRADPPSWLSLDWLSYWGRTRRQASKGYRESIAEVFGRPIPSPLAQVRGGLVLGGDALWDRVGRLLEDRTGREEVRWRRRSGAEAVHRVVRRMAAGEADRRLVIWMRVRLAGERPVDLAREYGYADGSGVLRVVQRVDRTAGRTPSLRNRLATARKNVSVSIVES